MWRFIECGKLATKHVSVLSAALVGSLGGMGAQCHRKAGLLLQYNHQSPLLRIDIRLCICNWVVKLSRFTTRSVPHHSLVYRSPVVLVHRYGHGWLTAYIWHAAATPISRWGYISPHVCPAQLRCLLVHELSSHHVFLGDDLVVVLSLHARHHEAHECMHYAVQCVVTGRLVTQAAEEAIGADHHVEAAVLAARVAHAIPLLDGMPRRHDRKMRAAERLSA